MKPYYITMIVMLILSCNSSQDDNIVTYNIDINNLSHQDDIFENFHYLKLETTDDNIITEIDKIEFNKDSIYILDKKNKTLFIFDDLGNYIDKISCFGKGHGEYLSIDDFQIFDNKIYILSRISKKIYIYNSECNFIKDIILDDWYNNIHIIDNKNMYLYSEESNEKKYNFILYDYINDLYLDKFDKNQNFCFFKTPFNKTQNGDIFILKQFSNTVFSLNNNSYNPICKFDYNTKDKMLDKYAKMSKEDLYNELLTKSIVQRILGIDVNNNKICMYYEIMLDNIGYRTFVTIIDKNNGEIKTCRIGDEINKEIPIMGNKILLTKDYLISYLPAFVVIDLDNSLQLGLSKNMTVTDNPILFFYKIKL